jgi:hypothetical protein
MDGEQVQMSSNMLHGAQTAVEVFRVLSVSSDLDQTLNAVLDGLKSLISYNTAGIYVVEPEFGRLRAQVVRGYAEDGKQINKGD